MELEKMKKVNEILQLCFEINGFEKREREKTGNKPTIFVDFSGHTAVLEIEIYQTGWYAKAEEDVRLSFRLNRPFYDIKEYMEECIAYLKELKEVSQHEYLQQAI